MVRKGLYLGLLLAYVVALVSCAPKAAPMAPPALATPQVVPAVTTPAVPAMTLEEVAWAKVVQTGRREGRATIYSFPYVGDVATAITSAFYERYGIRLGIISGPGASLVERLRTEQRVGTPTADVMQVATPWNKLLADLGLLESVSKELLGLSRDFWLVSPVLEPQGRVIAHYVGRQVPWVNTKLVQPDKEPRSWFDFVEPQWKNKILVVDPLTTSFPDRVILMLTKYKVVDADYFAKLRAQNLIFPPGGGPMPPMMSLARGEGSVLLFGAEETAGFMIAQGAPVKPIVPQEGVIVSYSTMALTKNAPHPNAGKLFIDFVLSKEGQEIQSKVGRQGTMRKDVVDYGPMAGVVLPRVLGPSLEDEDQINANFKEGVAAKLLGRK